MYNFESARPSGFHNAIHKKVTTMPVTKKHVRIGEVEVLDAELIHPRVIRLQATSCEIDNTGVFLHKLAPIPTSMGTSMSFKARNAGQMK